VKKPNIDVKNIPKAIFVVSKIFLFSLVFLIIFCTSNSLSPSAEREIKKKEE